ncbi:MAG TPA: DUF4136 domain-containing protein [Myxococcota bacterium]|nr:DUF4136 domain-containing protein [Myxococcota bacterium]
MSRTLRVTRALVLLLALSACSSVQVKQDWDPQANFAALHRWSWQSSTPVVTGNPRLDDPLVHKRIQGALADTLRTKGYAQTTSKPDFLVTYHIAIEQKLDAQTIYTGYGPYRGWYGVGGTQTVVEQYDLGTLLVDFIDPNTNNVIWRGTAQSRLQELKTPEEREARVKDAVERLLAQFPPTQS